MNTATRYPSTILYADDDYDDHFFLGESVSGSGLPAQVEFVTDGDQVIRYLEQITTSALPSLIVLDLNMPKRDGKQTLEYLKKHPQYASIPVIILSTSDNKLDKEYCASRGAASYLVKPGHFGGYSAIVQSFKPYLQTIL